MKKTLTLLLVPLFASQAFAAAIGEIGSWKVTIVRQQTFSGLEGFIQIPMGGQPGSGSPHRPTFDEIDFRDMIVKSGGLVARRFNHSFSLIGHIANYTDTSIISTDFVNHREEYFAGDQIHTDFKTDIYLFKHQYHLPLRKRMPVPVDVSLGPCLCVWDFSFRIIGPNGMEGVGGRAFTQSNIHFYSTARVGFGRLKLTFNTLLPLPVELHNFSAMGFEAISEYLLIDRNLLTCTVMMSISYTRIRFEDDQGFPNSILVDLAPILNVGFRIRL